MSGENKSIHEFEFDLICEYFSSMERQGPGSEEATITALSFIDNLTDESRIIDVGCGTGGQTITLARNTKGHITGIDLFQKFIDIFNENISKLNLQNRVKGIAGSMEKLPYENEELDLIWAEASIYNIGYRRGLKEWRRCLKPGGFIAVTDASWFTEDRPDEINAFWNMEYTEIDTIPKKVEQMQEAGYLPAASFVLPKSCWSENYYEPQVEAQEIFLKKYAGNDTAEELIKNLRYEAELYKKYSDFYGYVFYIGKKI